MTTPLTPGRREEVRSGLAEVVRDEDLAVEDRWLIDYARELLAEVDRAQAVEALVTRPFGSGTVEEIARWKQRAERATLALRNVRALALRMRKSDPENAGHLLRFCASVGVVASVLREGGSER